MLTFSLILVIFGTKLRHVIQILALLIIYNLSSILNYIFWEDTHQSYFLSGIEATTNFLLYCSFSCAQWIFAFKYYQTARLIPFVIKQKIAPESMIETEKTVYTVFIALNIAVPFV